MITYQYVNYIGVPVKGEIDQMYLYFVDFNDGVKKMRRKLKLAKIESWVDFILLPWDFF